MQWLIHGTITPAFAEALRKREHQTHDLSELALATDATDHDLLKAAQARQWDIITTDSALATAAFVHDYYFKRSIVYLQLDGAEVEQDDAIDRLFARYKRLTPGRLYTVTATRVKIRQLPGA